MTHKTDPGHTSGPSCPYCHTPATLVNGLAIYPHRRDLKVRNFYLCRPCDAYVGCHPETTKALGTLANAELRELRKKAHATFDPMWKAGYFNSRSAAYKWLSAEIGRTDTVHIGMSGPEQCKLIIQACENYIDKLK